MNRTPFAWRYTAREARRRPGRSLLTLAGIVLGVAAATAVGLGSRASHTAYPGTFDVLAGRAQLELRGPDGHAFFAPPDGAGQVRGVAAAVPMVQVPVGLSTRGGPEPVMLLGIDPRRDGPCRDWRLREGEAPATRRAVWLEADFARRHGLKVGDDATLLTARGHFTLPIAGLLDGHGPARFNGGAVAVVPLDAAQTLLGVSGHVNSVSVVIEPGHDVEAVGGRLRAAYPDLSVVRPAERGAVGDEFLASIDQALGSMSAVAVVAGAMVILNTFLMHLGERQRQLALLRALGATRRQVTALLLRQALLLGGVGTLLGVPAGVLLAWGLLVLYEDFMRVPMHLTLSWPALLLAAALGPLMTLAATVYPAQRAARREPLADLGRRPAGDGPPPRWPPYVGAALLVVVIAFEVAIVRRWLPASIGLSLLAVACGCGMVGCACLLPLIQAPLLRLVGLVVGPALGVEGRLAVRSLLRHRARTGLTIGVLFAAVAAALAFGVSLLNNAEDVRLWYRHTIDADYLVRAVRPDPAVMVTPSSLPPDLADEVAGLPGAGSVDRIRFVQLRHEGVSFVLIARDFNADAPPFFVHEGGESLADDLRAGKLVVGSALAYRLGLKPGDTIRLRTATGPRDLTIAAVSKEYTGGGMATYADYEHAKRWFAFDGPHAVAVRARPGEQALLGEELDKLARRDSLWVQPGEDFNGTIERVIQGVYWLIAAMVALIAAMAAAGVVNTLTTNVLDQTRELGVLRALGMKRGGVVKLVLAQALAVAAVTCLTGGPVGLLIAWMMNLATPPLTGHHVEFGIRPLFVLACLAAVPLLAVTAALLPARRAARLLVIDAVRHE